MQPLLQSIHMVILKTAPELEARAANTEEDQFRIAPDHIHIGGVPQMIAKYERKCVQFCHSTNRTNVWVNFTPKFALVDGRVQANRVTIAVIFMVNAHTGKLARDLSLLSSQDGFLEEMMRVQILPRDHVSEIQVFQLTKPEEAVQYRELNFVLTL